MLCISNTLKYSTQAIIQLSCFECDASVEVKNSTTLKCIFFKFKRFIDIVCPFKMIACMSIVHTDHVLSQNVYFKYKVTQI